jgi:hypothetical protein
MPPHDGGSNEQARPLHFASNLLISNSRQIISFTANPLCPRQEQQSLNQRVQIESLCK